MHPSLPPWFASFKFWIIIILYIICPQAQPWEDSSQTRTSQSYSKFPSTAPTCLSNVWFRQRWRQSVCAPVAQVSHTVAQFCPGIFLIFFFLVSFKKEASSCSSRQLPDFPGCASVGWCYSSIWRPSFRQKEGRLWSYLSYWKSWT